MGLMRSAVAVLLAVHATLASAAGAPPLSASPNPLAFGDVARGNTSVVRQVTVTVNNTTFAFGKPTLTGNNAADFAITGNTCAGAKLAGKSCAISVTFTPRQPTGAAETATLNINNAANATKQTVALTGSSATQVLVTPSSLSFGTVTVGSTSPTQSVAVSNRQSSPVSVSTSVSGAGFAIASSTCGTSLAAFSSCALQVRFKPASDAAITGALLISTSPDNQSPHSVTLTGKGQNTTQPPPTVPAAPTNVTANAGDSQVMLAWSASSGATGYKIFQGTSAGGEGASPVATVSAAGATIAGLTNGTKYFFKVAAYNSVGTSALSSEVSATPVAGVVKTTANPVLFVTQVPSAAFLNVSSAFGAIQTSVQQTPRGGDLWIRYPDGSLRNLTAEAGFGMPSGSQDGANAIAVRQPTVHWSGTKAIFSMLVGAPAKQYDVATFKWQIYEVSGLAKGQTASITKVACQPAQYNNLAPFYGSDDQVIFTSDRPRNGVAFLYPQRDEYESQPTESGLWKLKPSDCTSLRIIDHTPSGATYPSLDANGRIVMTKWDHLIRDQQADHDQFDGETYGTFNYNSETDPSVPSTHSRAEVFPELRKKEYSSANGQSIAPDYPYNDFAFNQFIPWMINQDGSVEETLDHVGRHEIGGSYDLGNFRADPNLRDTQPGKFNGATYFINGGGTFHLREDPLVPGMYYCVVAPEFSTATGGDLVRIAGAPGTNPDGMKLELLASVAAAGGRYRNPLPLRDGNFLAAFTPNTDDLSSGGTSTAPTFNYNFRLRFLGASYAPSSYLSGAGISKSVQYWDPDQRVSWSGTLWELDPAEVVARSAPTKTTQPALPSPEASLVGSNETLLRLWLQQKGLALIVSRNVTQRDRADMQQPFNLKITGSTTQTLGTPGATPYNISHLQLYQGDQLRGYADNGTPQSGGTVKPGRRLLAQPMHDAAALAAMGARLDSAAQTPLAADGSFAAFVPAGRAMTWQLVDNSKAGWSRGIVRERNWVSFKAGELRVCANCHGINTVDQAGGTPPTNPPQALTALMTEWMKAVRNNCPVSGGTGAWSFSGVPFSNDNEGTQYRIQTCQGGACCDGLPATETQAAP